MVAIYTLSACPYCVSAKALLSRKGVAFEEYSVDGDPKLRQDLRDRTGLGTLPQIFVDEHHVGGRDALYALDRDGRLDALLFKTVGAG